MFQKDGKLCHMGMNWTFYEAVYSKRRQKKNKERKRGGRWKSMYCVSLFCAMMAGRRAEREAGYQNNKVGKTF